MGAQFTPPPPVHGTRRRKFVHGVRVNVESFLVKGFVGFCSEDRLCSIVIVHESLSGLENGESTVIGARLGRCCYVNWNCKSSDLLARVSILFHLPRKQFLT